jgi:sugar-specific transcriptional regulator TrmB
MNKLNKLLRSLGFDEEESAVYFFLIRQGQAPVGVLAKRLGMPRTTLYTMLHRLVARGLVRETTNKGLKTFVAEPPDSISLLFSQRAQQLEKSKQEFAALLPELRKDHRLVPSTPRLSVFEGKDGVQNVLKDMLLYSDLETCAVWPIKKMIAVLSGDFFHFHNKERIRRSLYTRAIWPHDQVVPVSKYPALGSGKRYLREIRIAPKEISFALGYWIYADKVAFLSSAEEGYGYIIQSQELVQTLKVQFEFLWAQAQPLASNEDEGLSFLREIDN